MKTCACGVSGRIRRGMCNTCYGRWYRDRPDAPSCSVTDCRKAATGRGMCGQHYIRWRKHGDPSVYLPPVREGCDVEGCARPHFGRGYCSGHYARLVNTGNLRAETPLRAWRGRSDGYVNAKGYFVLPGGVLEHRAVMAGIIERPLLPDETVHHRNGVRLDNSPTNLELWVSSHPAGQRVEDVVEHARTILERYAPHLLATATLAGAMS